MRSGDGRGRGQSQATSQATSQDQGVNGQPEPASGLDAKAAQPASAALCREAELDAVFSALEQLRVDLEAMSEASVTDFLGRRQELLTQVQNADVSGLKPSARADLRTRLLGILKADEALLDAVQKGQKELQNSMKAASHGKRAARGYRRAQPTIGSALERDA